jgi:hypothetical protein
MTKREFIGILEVNHKQPIETYEHPNTVSMDTSNWQGISESGTMASHHVRGIQLWSDSGRELSDKRGGQKPDATSGK